MCGSQGTHLHCSGLSENRSENPVWECNECKLILSKIKSDNININKFNILFFILEKSGNTSMQHIHSSSASTPINRQ